MSGAVDYFRIAEDEPLPDISGFRPFRAVIVIDSDYSPEWQDRVSDWLAASGCLYMLAWGMDCSSWDDSVDYANLRQFSFEEVPEESFIYTTWHEKQTLDDIFWEAQFVAEHSNMELRSSLILHIGSENRRHEMLARWEASRTQI